MPLSTLQLPKSDYEQIALNFIATFESFRSKAYEDTNEQKLLTIGHGFNLEDRNVLLKVLNQVFKLELPEDSPVLEDFLKITQSEQSVEQKQQALNSKLSELTSGVKTEFVLNKSESLTVLDSLLETYTNIVDSKISLSELPYSTAA